MKPNGDGNGFKFGFSDRYSKSRGKDKGTRLIYGSAACYNRENGFDRNSTSVKIVSKNLHALKNRTNYREVENIRNRDDRDIVKCKTISRYWQYRLDKTEFAKLAI